MGWSTGFNFGATGIVRISLQRVQVADAPFIRQQMTPTMTDFVVLTDADEVPHRLQRPWFLVVRTGLGRGRAT